MGYVARLMLAPFLLAFATPWGRAMPGIPSLPCEALLLMKQSVTGSCIMHQASCQIVKYLVHTSTTVQGTYLLPGTLTAVGATTKADRAALGARLSEVAPMPLVPPYSVQQGSYHSHQTSSA